MLTANARENEALDPAVAETHGMAVAETRGMAVAEDQAPEAQGLEAGRNPTDPGEDPVEAAPTKAEDPTAMVEAHLAEATTRGTTADATPARQTRMTRAGMLWPLMRKAKRPEHPQKKGDRLAVRVAGRHTVLNHPGAKPRHVGAAQACQTQVLDMVVRHRVAWTRHLHWRGSNMPVSAAVDQLAPTQVAAHT